MPFPLEALLVAISLGATVVNGRKLWWGWFLTSATCISWTTYFTITDQWGPAVLQAVSAIITARNGAIWYLQRQSQPVTGAEKAPGAGITESHKAAVGDSRPPSARLYQDPAIAPAQPKSAQPWPPDFN